MDRYVILPLRRVWPYVAGVLAFAAATRLGLGSQALDRVGLSAGWAFVILSAMLACRELTLPVYVMQGGQQRLRRLPVGVQRVVLRINSPFFEDTAVSVSGGGVLVPLAASIYAIAHDVPNAVEVLNASALTIGIVELVRLALLRANLGSVGLLAPVVALLLGWTLPVGHRTALVLVSGFVAVLATTDLPVLNDLQTIGRPKIVIGGEASFGAIFLNCMFSLLFT